MASDTLKRIIREEMIVGPLATFEERLYRRLFAEFATIKSEVLREILFEMKHDLENLKISLEEKQSEIHRLLKERG